MFCSGLQQLESNLLATMHITEDQAAVLSKLAPDEVAAVTESAISEPVSAGSGSSARRSECTLAVLAVLLAAARAPAGDAALLAASLQSAGVPAGVLEPLLAAAAHSRARVRALLEAGRPERQQLAGLDWRLSAVVGSRALPAQLQPELLLRLRLTQEPRQLSLVLEPADLRHVTAELERALGRRPTLGPRPSPAPARHP